MGIKSKRYRKILRAGYRPTPTSCWFVVAKRFRFTSLARLGSRAIEGLGKVKEAK